MLSKNQKTKITNIRIKKGKSLQILQTLKRRYHEQLYANKFETEMHWTNPLQFTKTKYTENLKMLCLLKKFNLQ